MEVQFLAVFLSAESQLTQQGFLIHTDAHGRKLYRAVQYVVPNQQVAVQARESGVRVDGTVVIVVRGTVIVLLTVAQFASDTDDEYGTIFLGDGMLPFLRSKVRILLHQFFRMDKVDVVREERLDLRIHFAHHVFRTAHGRVDTGNDLLQEIHGPLFGGDGAFPVPLVHVERVQVAQFLVGTDGVHIGIDTIARADAVFCQGQTFPLRQGVNHFGLCIAQILDRERNGTFHPVQVVVYTHSFQYEQGSRHTAEAEFRRQVLLEKVLYLFDTQLGLFQVEQRLIVFRFYQITHSPLNFDLNWLQI